MEESLILETVRYTDEHEWISLAAPWKVGVSDYAQHALGDLVYVEMPEPGTRFAKGEEFGTLESTKSVSSLFMPVSGVIKAVNEALTDAPELVNRSPYGEGWIVEIEEVDEAELNELFDAQGYRAHLEKL